MSLSFVVFDCFFFFLYFYLSFFLYFSLSFPCLLLNNRFLLLPPPASTCLMRKYKNGISSSDGKKTHVSAAFSACGLFPCRK